jgi:hypothetical protein
MTSALHAIETGTHPLPVPDERVACLPASARAVYATLERLGPLTHKELLEATPLPGRTIRYAVSRLRGSGAIGSRVKLADSRQTYYFVQRTEPPAAQPARLHRVL